MQDNKITNPKVGFLPLTFNLAETGRAILVAENFNKLGGNPIFFSHGGKYEYLLKKTKFEVIQVKPLFNDEIVDNIVKVNRGEKKGIPYTEKFLEIAVEEEINAFKKTNIKMIVTFANNPTIISSKAAKIPHIKVAPGGGTFYLRMPESFENGLTRLIPNSIKIAMANKFFHTGNKKELKPFNKVAKKYDIKPFRNFKELFSSDIILATNFVEYLDIFPNQKKYPDKDYVGIILLEDLFKKIFPPNENEIDLDKIKKHIKNQNQSIFLTMGSSGDKKLFLNLINALNKTQFRVIVLYGNILEEKELKGFNENILFEKFVRSTADIHKLVDLSIIHGGQGTVFTAVYAGKPIIGIPMQFEQHLHLEKIQGHETGIMLSKKNFNEKEFLCAVEKIFKNYDYYLKKATYLQKNLPPPNGAYNAAVRINEILEMIIKKNEYYNQKKDYEKGMFNS